MERNPIEGPSRFKENSNTWKDEFMDLAGNVTEEQISETRTLIAEKYRELFDDLRPEEKHIITALRQLPKNEEEFILSAGRGEKSILPGLHDFNGTLQTYIWLFPDPTRKMVR